MKKIIKELSFKILIEQDEDGMYVASVPELPGCYTQAKTLKQLRTRIREVIELVLETEKELLKHKLQASKPYPKFYGVEDITVHYA